MDVLQVLDSSDYNDTMKRIIRYAVRGIIMKDDKIAIVNDKYGGFKLPGGGMEQGESKEDTLIREVLEETGLHVIPDSYRPLGEIIEIRKDLFSDSEIFEQHSYYYFCDVTSDNDFTSDDNVMWLTLHDVYKKNKQIPQNEIKAWTYRDTLVMKMLIELEM